MLPLPTEAERCDTFGTLNVTQVPVKKKQLYWKKKPTLGENIDRRKGVPLARALPKIESRRLTTIPRTLIDLRAPPDTQVSRIEAWRRGFRVVMAEWIGALD